MTMRTKLFGSSRLSLLPLSLSMSVLLAGCNAESAQDAAATPAVQTTLIQLWSEGSPAFGVFVPNERPRDTGAEDGSRLPALYTAAGGTALAQNDLLDYVFLNLEADFDPEAVTVIAEGLAASGVAVPPTLLVRIPPISSDGVDAARARVADVLSRGAQGIVLAYDTLDESRCRAPAAAAAARRAPGLTTPPRPRAASTTSGTG